MHKLNTLLITSIFTFFLPLSASAENLLDIYKLAETNDAQIRAAKSQYHASAQEVAISRSALLPNLSASVSEATKEEYDPNVAPRTVSTNDTSGYSITLEQSIYNHANIVGLSQAKLGRSRAETNYAVAQQDLIIRVAEAYFNLLAALDNLEFAEAEKKSVEQQLQQTQQRFEVGLIAITDVKESQAQYDLAVASEIQARNTLSTRREALFTITSLYPEAIKPLAEEMQLVAPSPDNIQEWVDSALTGNLALISSGFQRDIAEKEISRIRARHYPSLNLTARRTDGDSVIPNVDPTQSQITESVSTSVALTLSVPIFSGGGTSAQVRQALYSHEAARDQYESQRRLTIQQTRDTYQSVIADISRVKALKQALASTQAAYEATNAGYEVGTRNSVEVLVSLRETFLAKRNYSQARYDYLLNSLRLKKAAGTLNPQDLEAINRWLQ